MHRHIAGICAVVACLAGSSVRAQLPPQFVREWGQFGTATGSFNEPYAVAVAPDGSVYVSDTVNYRIQKFDADGNFLLTWGSFGTLPGQFQDPVGLTVDDAGNVWVAEFTGDRVQKFSATGTLLDWWGTTGTDPGQFRTADDICVDGNGDVFVADKNNHRVQKFTNDGTFIRQWGGFGTGNGQFKFPVGVKCDAADNVYVVEQGGNRVQKFDGDGNFIRAWGTPGAGPGQFNEPIHLDIDAADLVYVPDSKNHRIQVFDRDGNFVAQWGIQGTGEGQFTEPEGVGVGTGGVIYVADTHNHRIQKFAGSAAACADCPPTPLPNTAQFRVGAPVPLGGDEFSVTLEVDTAEMITFSQMSVEFDDACLSFISASVGPDVTNPGGIFVNEAPGATDPGSNRHVLVNVTGDYGPGCGRRVFVLRFESLVGPFGPCRIVWDRNTPAGNPPNHLNTAANEQIRFPAVRFCDLDGFDTRTTFRVGDAVPSGGGVSVPLLVTTDQAITFTQMTVEYDGDCLTFVNATTGAGVTSPGSVFFNDLAGATDPLLDRHVLVNATGEYGPGTDVEVFRLQFNFTGGVPSPCRIVWDRSAPISNPPNHLITVVPSMIRPEQIQFIDGAASTDCSDIHVSGSVHYFSNGAQIRPGIPDAMSSAVNVLDCDDTANDIPAANATYTLPFGDGPLAQVCICAERPKADCSALEGGVISGNDLLLIQDFIALIGTPPTPRQIIAADLNRDGMMLANDVMAIKQWIGHAAVCTSDKCNGSPSDNCAGTWRFVYPTGPGAGDFATDERCLTDVCSDRDVDIEGILLGDVDASWPNIFPTGPAAAAKPAAIALELEVVDWENDIVTLALAADLQPGQALHHVVYSLGYDASAFTYLGAHAGARATNWDVFDNAAEPGVAHGIVHRLAGMAPVRESGEVATFRFRAVSRTAAARFAFSRLAANDVAITGVGVETGARVRPETADVSEYRLDVHPNPFNPSTNVGFTIPAAAGVVDVGVHVYDIAGRLVRALFDGQRGPGVHETVWHGTDDRGHRVGAGVYLIRCSAGDWSAVRRVALVK